MRVAILGFTLPRCLGLQGESRVSSSSMAALIDRIRMIGPFERLGFPKCPEEVPLPFVFECTVFPYLWWDRPSLEHQLDIVLPEHILQFWRLTSTFALFHDVNYGQHGLVIWSPDQALSRHMRHLAKSPGEYLPGDFLIGSFFGDPLHVLLRCDPTKEDFGSIIVDQPIDPRAYWPHPASTFGEFLERFIDAEGVMYWEPGGRL